MTAVTVGPEALTLTWVAAGGLIFELLVLIVFLVRVAWWLSGRLATIDAALAALEADVSNDIAGRRAVSEARTDLAHIKTTVAELRDRIDRIDRFEDRR